MRIQTDGGRARCVGPADSLGPDPPFGARRVRGRPERATCALLERRSSFQLLLRHGRLLYLGRDSVSGRVQRLREGTYEAVGGDGGR